MSRNDIIRIYNKCKNKCKNNLYGGDILDDNIRDFLLKHKESFVTSQFYDFLKIKRW